MTLNQYVYALNNPETNDDPSGHMYEISTYNGSTNYDYNAVPIETGSSSTGSSDEEKNTPQSGAYNYRMRNLVSTTNHYDIAWNTVKYTPPQHPVKLLSSSSSGSGQSDTTTVTVTTTATSGSAGSANSVTQSQTTTTTTHTSTTATSASSNSNSYGNPFTWGQVESVCVVLGFAGASFLCITSSPAAFLVDPYLGAADGAAGVALAGASGDAMAYTYYAGTNANPGDAFNSGYTEGTTWFEHFWDWSPLPERGW